MGSDDNVLIVEDDDEWCKIYERAVNYLRPGLTVKVAWDLAGAERLIDSTKFAVAFVDIGLDVSEDQNVDGRHVMKRIRDIGDETSIVVVTGRSGQDVVPIIRDSIKEYQAYDTIGKSAVGPADIKRLLNGALEEYRIKSASGRMAARDSIRGTVDALIWDDGVTRAINFRGSVNSFYDFLDQLISEYLPLVMPPDVDHAHVDEEHSMVYGSYWSRAVAAGLIICFGSETTFDEALKAMSDDATVLKGVASSVPVKELVGHGVKGAVFVVEAGRRDQFRPSR